MYSACVRASLVGERVGIVPEVGENVDGEKGFDALLVEAILGQHLQKERLLVVSDTTST